MNTTGSAPAVLPQDALLERRASVLRLLESIEAELANRHGWTPPVTGCVCGHVSAVPAVLVPGGWECSACALKRYRTEEARVRVTQIHGHRERAQRADAARECQTEYAAHFGLLPEGD